MKDYGRFNHKFAKTDLEFLRKFEIRDMNHRLKTEKGQADAAQYNTHAYPDRERIVYHEKHHHEEPIKMHEKLRATQPDDQSHKSKSVSQMRPAKKHYPRHQEYQKNDQPKQNGRAHDQNEPQEIEAYIQGDKDLIQKLAVEGLKHQFKKEHFKHVDVQPQAPDATFNIKVRIPKEEEKHLEKFVETNHLKLANKVYH